MSKKTLIHFLIPIVCCVIFAVSFFLPIVSVKGEYKDIIVENADVPMSEDRVEENGEYVLESDMKVGDLANISMFDFVIKDYKPIDFYKFFKSARFESIILIICIILIIVFTILKKPIPILFMNFVNFGIVMSLHTKVYLVMSELPDHLSDLFKNAADFSPEFAWGVAPFLFYILTPVMYAISIMQMTWDLRTNEQKC